MNPVISIVTGSVRRLDSLQKMVESARRNVPYGVPYEIIVVGIEGDAETAAWCEAQPDIRFIAQRGLQGAIRAFDAGAKAARGEYVLLANDDVVFGRYSIAVALRHLETHPACGAVAFADDRPAPHKHLDTLGYGVQALRARPENVIYAQVGLFRRWLGNIAGWWGSDDPIMRQAHTYGGDNYLSARIWELGYSVDAVEGARVKDLIPRDELRKHNAEIEAKNPGVYYKRYPDGPKLAAAPLIPPLERERLRVLYLPVYEPGAHYAKQKQQKRGLREAFAKLGLVWEVDYVNEAVNLPALVEAWQPDILFTQLHSAVEINAATMAAARAVKPDMLVMNWNGDVWSRHLLEPGVIEILRQVDLQLCVNASVLPRYEQLGIRAAYWQCGFEPVGDELPDVAAHDVLLLANCYSDLRKQLGAALASLEGVNLGIYGSGWGKRATANTTYDFATSAALINAARIVIGDNQFPEDYGFVSNRVFDTLAHGGFLLHQHVPGMKELLGITPGVHFIEWKDLDDLKQQIAFWLRPENDADRRTIAEAGQRHARYFHSFEARLRQLFDEILPQLIAEKVALAV